MRHAPIALHSAHFHETPWKAHSHGQVRDWLLSYPGRRLLAFERKNHTLSMSPIDKKARDQAVLMIECGERALDRIAGENPEATERLRLAVEGVRFFLDRKRIRELQMEIDTLGEILISLVS